MDPTGSTLILPDRKCSSPRRNPARPGEAPSSPYMGLDHFGMTVVNMDEAVAELKAKGVVFTMEPKQRG